MSNLIEQSLLALEQSGSNPFTKVLNESSEKPSIAHLAADHYHHVGMGSDYNDEASSKVKATHRKQAKEILSTVEKHYGKEAASDVEHHTNHAFSHDNSSGPAGSAGTHTAFAAKHLDGKGSAKHKEYVARLNHHGYETGSDTGMHTND